jgi:hypothetical protein
MGFGVEQCLPNGGPQYCWLTDKFDTDGDIAGPGVSLPSLSTCH